MHTALAVLLIVHGACAWSFKEFLSGEWTLERQRGGQVTRAVYSLRPVGPNLEGTYYEFTDQRGVERMTERRVTVTFSDDDGRRGSFQLAKQLDTAADWEADEASQPALRPVFEFDFAPYLGGKSWVSETRCLRLASRARHSREDDPRRASDQPPSVRPEDPAPPPAVRGVRAHARGAGGSHRTVGGCSSSHSASTPSPSPTSPRPTAPSPPRPRGSHSATARASLRGPPRAPKRRAYSAGTGCTSCSRSGSPDGATPRPRRRSADRAASARRTRRCASAAARSAAVSRTRTLSHLMG